MILCFLSRNASFERKITMVTPYNIYAREDWDAVVCRSANATFLLSSAYMDHNRSRFSDANLLIRNRKDKVVAVFPAVYIDAETVESHAGLTYGGLIYEAKLHAKDVIDALQEVCSFYQTKGIKRLIYKAIPHIYSESPSEADLYALVQMGGVLQYRALSSAIDLRKPLPFSSLRRRGINKALRHKISATQSADYKRFWPLLTEVLLQRHHVSPVHSLEEIEQLARLFPENICLYTAREGDEMLAGTVVYASRGVAHAQYIATNERGRAVGALDMVLSRMIKDFAARGYRWVDFGISTDHDGSLLNEGLLLQKEGFGARSVCYDTYLLNL